MLSSIFSNRIIWPHDKRLLRDRVFGSGDGNIPRGVLPVRVTVLETEINKADPVSGADKLSFSSSRVEPSDSVLEGRSGRTVPRPADNNGVVAVLINWDFFVANGIPPSAIGGSSRSRNRKVLQVGIGGQGVTSLAGLGVRRHLPANNQNVIEAEGVRDNQILGVRVVGKASIVVGRVVNDTLLGVGGLEGTSDTIVSIPENL